MNTFQNLVDIFLHLDKNVAMVIGQYGTFTYGLLFLVIFLETGFVVTPFLPGDSLIFAAGALSATSPLNIWLLYILFCLAAIAGDTVNYWVGRFIGPKVFEGNHRFVKKEYLLRAQKFYDKYGGQAITLGRFVPIVRTFVPFVAGVSKMSYKHFIFYNILGGILWVSLFCLSGYFFGNLPFIKANFYYAVLAIILISLILMVYEFLKSRQEIPTSH